MRRYCQTFVWTGLAALLLALAPARAQSAFGTVVGTVTDPSHAAIPAATVVVTNVATNVASAGVTDKNGYFVVPNVPIGNYTVTVSHDGFQKETTQAQNLQIGQTLRFTIAMKLGQASQAVTVEAEVAGVETENATVGATVTGNAIQNLPLNGRNVLSLAALQPGVTAANPAVGGVSVAGGRPDSITYLLDGGLNNDLLSNDVVFNPNPDTISEFKLLTSDYTAEYGRSGAGIISEVTKSGTNRLHGSAYDFVRNGDLNANTFFNNFKGQPRDTLKRNQFGGTVGGPVTIPGVVNGANKLFFFVGYQGQRQTDQQFRNQTPTFTPTELSGDFSKSNPDGSGTPDPNVVAFLQANPFFQSDPTLQSKGIIDPTKFDAAAVNIIKANLIPTAATGFVNSLGAALNNNNQITSRVDYAPNTRDKFTFTAGGQRGRTLSPFAHANVSGYPDSNLDNNYYTGLNETHTFSPAVLNEFHASVQRVNNLQSTPAVNLPNSAKLGIGLTPDLPIAPPDIDFDTGLTLGFSIQGPSNLVGTTWAYTDALTWVKGNHTWKMGGGFSAYEQNMVFDFIGNGDISYQGQGGNGSGNGFADFLLGIPNFLQESPDAPSNIRQKQTYAFLQDDWRLSNNLTVSLGLRYEFASPKTDTRGRSFGFRPGEQSQVFVNAPLGLVFPGDPGVPTGSNFADKDNFAPRLGFAWDPTGHGTTSIRGGAGVFYDVLKAEDNFQYNGQPPFASSIAAPFPTVGPGQSGPVGFMEAPFAALGIANPFPSKPPTKNLDFVAAGFIPYAPIGAAFVDPKLYTPYIYQYNLSVEHQLNSSMVAEVNYVGSTSKGLTGEVDQNPFILGTNNRMFNPAALAASPSISAACAAFAGAAAAADCPYFNFSDFANLGFASFNSVEASMTKRINAAQSPWFGNSAFTLAYTYGRSIDNESGFRNNTSTVPAYNHNQFRGPSDFDITHNLTFSGDWTLPFEHLWNAGAKNITGGWTLDPIFTWRNGFPLSPNAGINPNGDPSQPGPSGAGDGFLANAGLAAGISQVLRENPKLPGNHFFAKSDFTNALTAADPYGAPRGQFRGPGLVNLDMALVKSIALTEQVNMQLRGEAFNIFNHAEFNNPNLNFRSRNFGVITSTADPRIVQLAVHLSF